MATQPNEQTPFSPVPGIFDDALAAGSALSQPRSINVPPKGSSKPFQLVPEGYTVKDLEFLMPAPQRRTGVIVTMDVESFIDVVNDYRSASTRLYGVKPRVARGKATGEPTMTAVFDDHDAMEPGWGQFRAEYAMPLSFEWGEWSSRNGAPQSQDVFAVFMEDRYLDVLEPSAADMLEVSRSISAVRNATFKKAVHLTSGSNQFAYEDTTQASAGANGTITVPETFAIAIPVFQGGARFRVNARLRYRLDGNGRLALWFDLIEPHRVIETAVDDVWEHVTKKTEMAIVHGKPADPR
jgi:uncharacterized protein YfdQ (DUF2303 family)